jgi:hypothetical protein
MQACSHIFAFFSLANADGTECAVVLLPELIVLSISRCRFADISSWFVQCPARDNEFHFALIPFAMNGNIATRPLWSFGWNPGWIVLEFLVVGQIDFILIP